MADNHLENWVSSAENNKVLKKKRIYPRQTWGCAQMAESQLFDTDGADFLLNDLSNRLPALDSVKAKELLLPDIVNETYKKAPFSFSDALVNCVYKRFVYVKSRFNPYHPNRENLWKGALKSFADKNYPGGQAGYALMILSDTEEKAETRLASVKEAVHYLNALRINPYAAENLRSWALMRLKEAEKEYPEIEQKTTVKRVITSQADISLLMLRSDRQNG